MLRTRENHYIQAQSVRLPFEVAPSNGMNMRWRPTLQHLLAVSLLLLELSLLVCLGRGLLEMVSGFDMIGASRRYYLHPAGLA